MEEILDYGLTDKVAFVTGTASQNGMGKAICLTLAKEGCDIISADIDLDGAKQTADEVKTLKRKAIALKVDVTKETEVREAVNTALKEFGKIDIMVCTAGASTGSPPYLTTTREQWEKDINLNLYGTMSCCQAVLPGMIERKYGKIVNFSSISGRIGPVGSYAAAKAGVISLTQGLAKQFGPDNINVNGIAPAVVLTNFHARDGKPVDPKRFEGMAARLPMRRLQTVEDIANAVAFLVSDVSKNITGQTLQVDSGLVMV
jgi:2-hydroxycyclohexanecarboxyl-CoA dehydrogenase